MSDNQERAGFEALAQAGAEDAAARALGARLKAQPQAADLMALSALWIHAAAAAPERVPGLYDAVAEGYLGEPVGAKPVPTDAAAAPEPIPPAFWPALWDLLEEPPSGLEAVNLTTKTAALTGLVSANMQTRVGRAALCYPDVPKAVAQSYPKHFSLDALAKCPPASLGATFHDLIVDNGFDLEVLDRAALGLDKLPAPLDYLNARILQCHDLWHIVAGYQTTALHEVAISAFQLAQFGHHYSSMFLGMVLTRVAFERPEGGAIMLPVILTAWTHGRRTPPLLPVNWEAVWDKPLAEVRAQLGVTAYVSPFPADLFEQLSVAA
ncbi:Coq4 family protein [Phenylobacterium sp.]|jgi:ubiquinone biosynthesis protein Coq4|uniref:Coq4 family protein n=1 Tax=Phenylobacterium sp. TaxID=1871053 RepID=UPI002E332760|nr:Coq4 family protein [Phenylobacterium sp.]HEX3366242.1 Coq4 family protein [Phenylobacterium sp.]